MKPNMFLIAALTGLIAGVAIGQDAQPPKPAPAKAAPAKSAATTRAAAKPSPVDDVIKLVKSGMSESFIIKSLQKTHKAIDLTPADLVKLKDAGVSESIMSTMMDPSSAPAAAAEPAAASTAPAPASPSPSPVAPASTPPVTATVAPAPPPPSAPGPSANERKKRVIIDPFDYSAVMTAVQSVFGTTQNIGKGIQAMLVTRLQQAGKVVIVERGRVKEVMAEQDFNSSNRVKQGSGARIGKISGADAILAGDIVVFGGDDKRKTAAGGGLIGGVIGAVGSRNKEDKAVVAINYRLIDAETTEVIASGEARGESRRKSKTFAAFGAALGGAGAAGVDMTSSNFAETIIGEATQDCVNKLGEILNAQATGMKKAVREVEAHVADVSGASLVISAGGADGVTVGDVFEILRIDREVRDPVTKEVLDQITTKVGEATIVSVRDKIATGNYAGSAVKVGYAARKRMPAQQ